MEELKCRGYIGDVPVYCAHDKIVPVGEVKPNPKNPNQHPEEQIELLAKIIKTQGWRAPVTVSTLSGLVVRGHGRLMAAQLLGLDCVPVDFQHYESMDAELADLLADNKIAELAEIDSKMLAEVFQDIDPEAIDIDITGYSEEEYNDIISALMDATAPEPGELEADDPVEVQEKAFSRYGDMWLLGNHRLLCGDSTKQECVSILMDGDKADIAFTDPPWNVNYGAVKEGNAQGYKPRTILNDFMGTEDFKEFMYKAFQNLNFASKDGAMTYVVMSAQEWGNMMLTLAQNDYHWSSTIIWNKDRLVLSRKDYHTKYEPIWYGWKEGVRLCPLEDRKQSDVWDIERPMKSEEHPTMKPVELVERAITNSSHKGDIVIDLFGGSGTTLIASEQTGRICRMMELDPHYVDVIVKRYIGVTGKTDVTLLRDGEEILVEDTGIMH
jgi:DNA modification methylase